MLRRAAAICATSGVGCRPSRAVHDSQAGQGAGLFDGEDTGESLGQNSCDWGTLTHVTAHSGEWTSQG